MDLHIALVRLLKLRPCKKKISRQHSAAVAAACARLHDIDEATQKGRGDYAQENQTNNESLITWRPQFTKDIFILVTQHSHECVVGVLEHGAVQFLSSEDLYAALPNHNSAIFFAHVTCDVVEDLKQTVVLVYDMWFCDSFAQEYDVGCRYARLLEFRQDIENMFYLGHAIWKIQWLGHSECYEKLMNLNVPHPKDGVVAVGGLAGYTLV